MQIEAADEPESEAIEEQNRWRDLPSLEDPSQSLTWSVIPYD